MAIQATTSQQWEQKLDSILHYAKIVTDRTAASTFPPRKDTQSNVGTVASLWQRIISVFSIWVGRK